MNKNTICLWYNHDAEEAARFYAKTFPDSAVSAVHLAPSDYPGGKAGTVLTVSTLGTYGPSVFVNHGGGFYTIYLYLSRIDVKNNQAITKGQVIGLSGGASSQEGPHIEFQIRGEGGIALDPVNWLKNHK